MNPQKRRLLLFGGKKKKFINQYSMLFDGVDEVINIDSVLTNSLATTTKGTWSCWVKPLSAPNVVFFLGFGDTDAGNRLIFFTSGTAQLRFIATVSGVNKWDLRQDVATLSSGAWSHIAVTQGGIGTDPVLYINGNNPAQTFTATDKTIWFNDLSGLLDNGRIATYSYNGVGETGHYDGNIDELSFWDTDLSLSEIQEIYNNGKPNNLLKHSKSGNLVSYFRMGDKSTFDGSNFTLVDQKSSNNGLSVNMELSDKVLDTP